MIVVRQNSPSRNVDHGTSHSSGWRWIAGRVVHACAHHAALVAPCRGQWPGLASEATNDQRPRRGGLVAGVVPR